MVNHVFPVLSQLIFTVAAGPIPSSQKRRSQGNGTTPGNVDLADNEAFRINTP